MMPQTVLKIRPASRSTALYDTLTTLRASGRNLDISPPGPKASADAASLPRVGLSGIIPRGVTLDCGWGGFSPPVCMTGAGLCQWAPGPFQQAPRNNERRTEKIGGTGSAASTATVPIRGGPLNHGSPRTDNGQQPSDSSRRGRRGNPVLAAAWPGHHPHQCLGTP